MKDILESFFRQLCKYNIFHDYQTNEENEERCTFCNKPRNYDSVGGLWPG